MIAEILNQFSFTGQLMIYTIISFVIVCVSYSLTELILYIVNSLKSINDVIGILLFSVQFSLYAIMLSSGLFTGIFFIASIMTYIAS